MNDPEKSWRAAAADRARQRSLALAELGVSTTEATLFVVIQFGLTVPPDDLCRRATIDEYHIGDIPVTWETANAALADCFRKGWLQVVDETALAWMKDDVRKADLIGPVYGYPNLGGVDFTPIGAALWLRYEALLSTGRKERGLCWDCVHEKTAHYYCSESAARRDLEERRTYEGFFAATGPTPIGPWRAEWWRCFPEGYRVDIEQRMRWTGRAGDEGAYVFSRVCALPVDVERAKDALAYHGVDLYEWLAMLMLEWHGNPRHKAQESRQRAQQFGLASTDEDFRAGVDSCRRRAWLRPIDDLAAAEIRDRIGADAVVTPVPFEPEINGDELDFTDEGAGRYRALSAEIFGLAWEESVAVEDSYYREVHTYCTEIQLATGEWDDALACGRLRPDSIREIPIGPWCIYWWKRFDSGFRVEATYGLP